MNSVIAGVEEKQKRSAGTDERRRDGLGTVRRLADLLVDEGELHSSRAERKRK